LRSLIVINIEWDVFCLFFFFARLAMAKPESRQIIGCILFSIMFARAISALSHSRSHSHSVI
jgi:hypothetical protein